METPFEELKRYVRWSDADAKLLADLREAAEPHFPRIAQEFYDRIREHEEAHAVFVDEAQIQRLQRSLVRWLERIFGGVYDQTYFEQTAAIGRVHVRVGLPQRYMFTAMALIRSSLETIATRGSADGGEAARDALGRLLDLELAIMVGTYHDHIRSRLARTDELEREVLAAQVERVAVRYQHAMELAHLLVLGLDDQGRVILFNREAERLTGFAKDEALGQKVSDLFLSEGHASDVLGTLQEAVRTSTFVELLLPTRTKKLRNIRVRATRPPDDDVVLLAAGFDVTDETDKRERAHQQERLAALGTLAAGLAHEIRNPLNGAQLHVAYLERALGAKNAGDDVLDAVHVVGDEIKRLASLVTEFLDFARPRKLSIEPVNAQGLALRVMQLAQTAATLGRVTLRTDLPSAELVFEGDRAKLEQVLLNLTQNGVEALEGSSGAVILRVRREPRHVVFEVEDDGPGLSTDSAPVFDAFFSTKPGGTGLGLAIVHRIVTSHEGEVDVDSRPGRTVFRVRLPLAGPRLNESQPVLGD